MKRVAACFLFLMMLVGFTNLVQAQTFEGALGYDVSGIQFQLRNNEFFAGNQVRVTGGNTSERMFIAGNEVSLNNVELGSLFVAGNSIRIQVETAVGDGYIVGNQVMIEGLFRQLNLGGNAVSVNGSIGELNVSGNQVTLNGSYDAIHAAGEVVSFSGEVNDAKITGGKVEINGVVHGNLTISARDITFGPNAKILGKLTIEKELNQQILGYINPSEITFVDNHQLNLNVGWNPVVHYTSKLVNLFILFAVTIVFVKFGSAVLDRFETQFFDKPWLPFTLGLAGLVFIPLIMVVSAVTIVGIPITIILGVAYGLMLYLAPVISGTLIGRRSKVCQNPYGLACFGVLVLQFCTYAPFIGWVVSLASVLFSLGSCMSLMFTKK